MTEPVRVEGLRELDRKLSRVAEITSPANAKKILRSAMMSATLPVLNAAKSNAQSEQIRDSGALAASMGRWFPQETRTRFTLFIGPRSKNKKAIALWTQKHGAPPKGGRLRHAHIVEFGSERQAATPFLRPACESNQARMLSIFRRRLRDLVLKAARRG